MKKSKDESKNKVLEEQEKILIDSLINLAKGVSTSETVEEFILDNNGKKILKSQKVTTKNHAPDLSSIKILFDMNTNSQNLSSLSDEELELEKERLLKLLKDKS